MYGLASVGLHETFCMDEVPDSSRQYVPVRGLVVEKTGDPFIVEINGTALTGTPVPPVNVP